MGYYHAEDGMTVREISQRWMRGDKAYDMSMPILMSVDDLWPFRDYTWTQATSRRGVAVPYRIDPKAKEVDGPAKWSGLIDSFKQYGWDKEEPIRLTVAKDGTAKISEGNHRLAVAKQMGMKVVPVWVTFYDKNYQTSDTSRPPTRVEFKKWLGRLES